MEWVDDVVPIKSLKDAIDEFQIPDDNVYDFMSLHLECETACSNRTAGKS